MENESGEQLENKTDQELQEFLNHVNRYSSDQIEAVIAEFQKRGRIFSDEELRAIRYEVHFRGQTETPAGENVANPWSGNVVNDPNAPVYFSERAISIFSILFSTFFGSIMLASNLRKTESKAGSFQVIIFGLLYTLVQATLTLQAARPNSFLPLLFGMLGALILRRYFWSKYIGEGVKYQAKPIWVPLFIGIAILVLLIIANYYSGMLPVS